MRNKGNTEFYTPKIILLPFLVETPPSEIHIVIGLTELQLRKKLFLVSATKCLGEI